MPVPLVQQIQQGAADVAQAAADIATALAQVNGAPVDVNKRPVSSSGGLGDLVAGVRGALGDVHNAAQLKELLPVAIAVIGILTGRAVLGLVLAVLVYSYGQPAAPPAAT